MHHTHRCSGGGSYTLSYRIDVSDDFDGDALAISSEKAKAETAVTVTVTSDEGDELGSLTITDNKGNVIDVTKQDDGTCTFTMPKGKVAEGYLAGIGNNSLASQAQVTRA